MPEWGDPYDLWGMARGTAYRESPDIHMDIFRARIDHGDVTTQARPRGSRSARRLVWPLLSLLGLAAAGTVSLAVVNSLHLVLHSGLAVGAVATATTGALVVTRRPQTTSGWLLMGLGASVVLTLGLQQLAFLLAGAGAELRGVQALIGIGEVFFAAVVVLWPLLYLTFPDGRLPSPRWRLVVVPLIILGCVAAVATVLHARHIVDPEAYLAAQAMVVTTGVAGGAGYRMVFTVVTVLLPVALILSAVSLYARLQRAEGPRRQQVKWVVATGVVTLMLFPVDSFPASSPTLATIQDLTSGLLLLLVAGGFGVALLKHRLWDIEVVIRRSVVYGVLAALIAAVYGAVAVASGLAAGRRLPAGLAVTVAVVATFVFQPARRRLDRLATRWVFGERYPPVQAIHGFGEEASRARGPTEVAVQLARAVQAATGVVWVEVSLMGSEPISIGTANTEPETVIPISRGDERIGTLRCRPSPGMSLTSADNQLLAAMASQAGLAASHARLASRIVQAQDAERRRIERNIHDGAQQELVALMGRLALAQTRVDGDATLRDTLAESQRDVQHILANLRELAQGIHPPVLSDRGLVAAVEDRCSRTGISITIEVTPRLRHQRLPADIEAAAYFSVAEALTNVLKHAHTETARVRLELDAETLTVEVSDEGRGFDPETIDPSGLQGVRDRIQALSGEVTVESTPGVGTRLSVRLPTSSKERQ